MWCSCNLGSGCWAELCETELGHASRGAQELNLSSGPQLRSLPVLSLTPSWPQLCLAKLMSSLTLDLPLPCRVAAAAGPPLLPSVLWNCSPSCSRSCPVPALLSLSSAHLPLLSSPLAVLLEMLQVRKTCLVFHLVFYLRNFDCLLWFVIR